MSDVIAKDLVGIFHYTLTNDEGETLDSSVDGAPMPYLHGHGNIVPGLEKQMEGKAVGDKFTADVPPADGYGEYDEDGFFQVHRNEFPKGEFENCEEGKSFFADDGEGNPTQIWVVKTEGAFAHFTTNHPLSGQTLHFDIEIVGIRAANEEEMAHGHPHGLDGTQGHHH